jgi:hypothetical protein
MGRKRRQSLKPNEIPMVELALVNAVPNGSWSFTLQPTRQSRRVPRGQVQAARDGARKFKD